MDKNAIRDFAVRARYKLTSEIATKANMMGISENGIASPLAQSTNDIQYFDIGGNTPFSIQGDEISKRHSLITVINERIKSGQSPKDAFQDTVEEIAYTWFNRIIAIRFMEVNGYLPAGIRVLSSEQAGKKEPDIVTHYFDADLKLSDADIQKIELYKSKNKPDDLFKFLFIKQCNRLGDILPFLFEKTADYCDLMLSVSYTDEQGIVRQLVNSISEDDFKEAVEIIGWMYQYYIAQKKEEVFKGLKNNTKITKSTLPSATQIFTPDWIVKYMTDNTLGKMWIESHPGTIIAKECEYYLKPAEQEESVKKQLEEINKQYRNKRLEEITFIDPCCGSGHILVYAFDLFYKMYQEQGYVSSEIPALIVENNLYGIDVDKRAMQLTSFAISMKARSYDKRYFKKQHGLPNVIYMKESNAFKYSDGYRLCEEYFSKNHSSKENDMIEEIVRKFEDAELYGSLIKDFKYQSSEYRELARQLTDIAEGLVGDINDYLVRENLESYIIPLLKQAEILSNKYDIVVTNPPYAGNGKLSSKMQEFLRLFYENTKADLFSAFIERNMDYATNEGHLGIMCPYVWMFISSYEELRKRIINHKSLTSLVQLEYGGFAEAVVPICTFTFRNSKTKETCEFVKLEQFKGPEVQGPKTLEAVKNPQCGYRYTRDMAIYAGISGMPISFWASDGVVELFNKQKSLENYAIPKCGLKTGITEKYVKSWTEVSFGQIGFNHSNRESALKSKKKWFPIVNGGEFRKWNGNYTDVVYWYNDGIEIRELKCDNGKQKARPQNMQFYFRKGLTWSALTTKQLSLRVAPEGTIISGAGYGLFGLNENEDYFLALVNSNVINYLAQILSQTLNFEVGILQRLPIVISTEKKPAIEGIARDNTVISKLDWDSNETSWDFERSPLLKGASAQGLLKDLYNEYKKQVNERFDQLKNNEEELNRLFIDIYGLNDELTPDVEDKDITVARIYDTKEEVPENMRNNIYVKTKHDVVVDLISYIIGCLFGRYSPYKEGLVYAGGDFDYEEYETMALESGSFANEQPAIKGIADYNKYAVLPDKDNILPINDDEYFDDDIVLRIADFIRKVYGEESLEANLKFIADALGNAGDNPREVIRNYMLKDFFKDHCQKYSNRPIYWLFDSGKNNGFKALVYLHRYDENTIAKMRAEYLHKVQRVYESESARMQDVIDNSTDAREVAFARKQKEKLTKQLLETKEYDEVLGHIALQRIALDLDDGVVVNYQKFQNIDVISNNRAVKKNLLVDIYKGKK